jgi:hypothetical protein
VVVAPTRTMGIDPSDTAMKVVGFAVAPATDP